MTWTETLQAAIEELRQNIAGAGLMVSVRWSVMNNLATDVNWHAYPVSSKSSKVYDPETNTMVYTEQVPLSAAREMLLRAEQKMADRVAQALS